MRPLCPQCEVGMVYDQPEHAVVNRWLVLANPDEPTPTVQGQARSLGLIATNHIAMEYLS